MDSLPPELISHIVSYLIEARDAGWEEMSFGVYPRIAEYATISRQWQSAIEAITFRRLSLNYDRLVAAEAKGYLTPARLAHARCILFDFTFPHLWAPEPTDPEERDRQFIFNKSSQLLFNLLGRLPEYEKPLVSLICSKSGYFQGLPSMQSEIFRKGDCEHLELSSDWDRQIKDTSAIYKFEATLWSSEYPIASNALNLMAGKMTNLEQVKWWLRDEHERNVASVHQRTMFAKTLETLPKSIKDFSFEYSRPLPGTDSRRSISLVPHDAPGDVLSKAFRKFTQRDGLETCEIHGSFDSTILWPQSTDSDNSHWPTLEGLRISLDEILPSGQSIGVSLGDGKPYFGPENMRYLSSEESTYDQAILNQFALAAARGARHMPNMKNLKIVCEGWAEMGIGFKSPAVGEPCLEFTGKPILMQPSEETLNTWSETVKAHGLEWDVRIGP